MSLNQYEEKLDDDLFELMAQERKIMQEVLKKINQVTQRKVFAKKGYPSLLRYLVSYGFSEKQAWDRIQAAKLVRDIPEVVIAMEKGKINLTQASYIQYHFNRKKIPHKQKVELVRKIKNKSMFETKRTINFELYRKETLRKIYIDVSDNTYDNWKILCGLMAHKCRSYEEVLEELIQLGLKTYSPVYKKTLNKKEASTIASSGRYISNSIRKEVYKKADNRCEVCESQFALQVDHIIPFSKGGKTEINNLQLLCAHHNAIKGNQILKPPELSSGA